MKKAKLAAAMPILAIAAIFIFAIGCQSKRKIISSNGLHAIKLGQDMPAIGTEKLKGVYLRDTFVEEGDYQWRAVVMEYKHGSVYLEEDFFRSESLARIRICTPDLFLRNGLRVGMTVADLKPKASDWTIVPLPDYKLFDFYSRMFPRVHFIVDDPALNTDGSWTDYEISKFMRDARIVAIVVH